MRERRYLQWSLMAAACGVVVAGSVGWRDSAAAAMRAGTAGRGAHAERPPSHPDMVSHDTLMQVAAAPLHFERNDGQAPSGVTYIARGAGYAVLLSGTETAVVLSSEVSDAEGAGRNRPAIVRTRLVAASTSVTVTGEASLPGTVNYFRGKDPTRWQHGVSTYARVRAAGVYPGIDAVYYGNQRELQYDFEVAPGATPNDIGLAFDEVDDLEIEPGGDLVLRVGGQELRQKKPYSYQDGPSGREEVASRFVLTGERQVGFALGDYDTTRPLVIDPVLTYSSYFGGDSEEVAYDVALGPGGTVYITGITQDLAVFPTLNAFQPVTGSQPDAFVTKFQPNGASLSIAFSSYLAAARSRTSPGMATAATSPSMRMATPT